MTATVAKAGTADQEAARAAPVRTAVELLGDQLFGIDEWHRVYGVRAQARATAERTREARLDLNRRNDMRRAEHQALLDRARVALDRSVEVLVARPPVRAVLAHRNEWFAGKVADRLAQRGVDVLLVTQDGAQATGALVVEQPEILLVEDRLPTLNGLQVLERATRCCPHTLAAVQVLDTGQLEQFREGGARALFTRRVPPAEVADAVLDCLLEDQASVSVL